MEKARSKVPHKPKRGQTLLTQKGSDPFGLFITGTDTGVGKTAVTAALAWALRKKGYSVGVMKPVATGCARRGGKLVSDDARVLLRASGSGDPMELVCPYRFAPPVAPSIALRKGKRGLTLLAQKGSDPFGISIKRIKAIYEKIASRHDIVLVEGIGGWRVPLNENQSVEDLARCLNIPVLVVGRAGLGTINQTVLTAEAVQNSGLNLLGVVLNRISRKPSLAEKTNPSEIRRITGVPVLGVVPVLSRAVPEKIASALDLRAIEKALRGLPKARQAAARRLSRLDRKKLWHPFTQMREWEQQEPLIIESAQGNFLRDIHGRDYIDGVSSLWVNLHGHRHPALDAALRRQAGKIAHSTLLGAANVPSIELADALLKAAPKNLSRVFYSDSGSTAVEIALKMAFQYWQQNGRPKRKKFVHFVNAYHGDTIGSVSVGGIDLFHQVYGSLLFKGFKVPAPYPYRGVTAESSLAALRRVFLKHANEIAAVVVEPLVQGAAGIITQPNGWLKKVEQLCRRHGIFLIADEVAVGFGRTGTMFACEQEKVNPDFLCLAKGISGGYLPLAATLTTEQVYRGFLGSHASLRTFFHGHSYTGNPLACAVGLENLKIFKRERVLARLKPKIRLLARELRAIQKQDHVGDVRQRGLIAGIELVKNKKTGEPYSWEQKMGAQVCRRLRSKGILMRPLGNVIVILPPLSISAGELKFLCRQTRIAIKEVSES